MNEDNNKVIVSNKSGFKSEITSRGHFVISDEPAEAGGGDAGMSPYELLLAALGSCKAMTVRMYAKRKNYPLKDISIALSHSRIHAEDCADCETKIGRIDSIDVELTFTGELDREQTQRLLEISEKCPLHRTILSEMKINSIIKT